MLLEQRAAGGDERPRGRVVVDFSPAGAGRDGASAAAVVFPDPPVFVPLEQRRAHERRLPDHPVDLEHERLGRHVLAGADAQRPHPGAGRAGNVAGGAAGRLHAGNAVAHAIDRDHGRTAAVAAVPDLVRGVHDQLVASVGDRRWVEPRAAIDPETSRGDRRWGVEDAGGERPEPLPILRHLVRHREPAAQSRRAVAMIDGDRIDRLGVDGAEIGGPKIDEDDVAGRNDARSPIDGEVVEAGRNAGAVGGPVCGDQQRRRIEKRTRNRPARRDTVSRGEHPVAVQQRTGTAARELHQSEPALGPGVDDRARTNRLLHTADASLGCVLTVIRLCGSGRRERADCREGEEHQTDHRPYALAHGDLLHRTARHLPPRDIGEWLLPHRSRRDRAQRFVAADGRGFMPGSTGRVSTRCRCVVYIDAGLAGRVQERCAGRWSPRRIAGDRRGIGDVAEAPEAPHRWPHAAVRHCDVMRGSALLRAWLSWTGSAGSVTFRPHLRRQGLNQSRTARFAPGTHRPEPRVWHRLEIDPHGVVANPGEGLLQTGVSSVLTRASIICPAGPTAVRSPVVRGES